MQQIIFDLWKNLKNTESAQLWSPECEMIHVLIDHQQVSVCACPGVCLI